MKWMAIVLAAVVSAGCEQGESMSGSAGGPSPEPVEHAASTAVEVAPENLNSGRIAVEALQPVDVVPRRLLVSGAVEVMPSGASVLSAPTDARVTRVDVTPGERVKKGTVLVRLEASAVAIARAGLRRSEALEARARGLVEQEEQLERLQATSKRDSTLARQELELARAEQAAAEGNLRAWGTSRRGGSTVVLRAPFEGVVTHVGAAVGSSVPASSVLVRLLAPEALSVIANVPQHRVSEVALAQAELSTGDQTTARCTGTVLGHLYRVERSSGTVPFRVTPAEQCRAQLLEGAALEVAMPLSAKAEDAGLFSAPTSALTTVDTQPALFVQTGEQRFELHRVGGLEIWGDRAYFHWTGAADAHVATKGVLLLKGELMRGELE
jgi:RND family efflux transporter MFP subunit